MKSILNLICGVGIAIAALTVTPAALAADTSGIALSGPSGLDVGDPFVRKFYGPGTGTAVTRGLPQSVAPATETLCTNAIIPLIKGSDLTIQTYFGATPTNSAATTNCTLRFQASADGGVTYVTTYFLTLEHAINGSNGMSRAWTIPGGTNFGAYTHLKLYSLSNNATAGAGSVWPTNVIVSQWRRGPRNL